MSVTSTAVLFCVLILLAAHVHCDIVQCIFCTVLILVLCFAGFVYGILISVGKDLPLSLVGSAGHDAMEKLRSSSGMTSELSKRPEVTTLNLDRAIQELMDLVVRDYVLSWYSWISSDAETFSSAVKSELWVVVEKFRRRVKRIDKATFLSHRCVDALSQHLKQIEEADRRSYYGDTFIRNFLLHSCLQDEATELSHIRFVAEAFVVFLAPKPCAELSASRVLLREILACKVFKPAIDLITDPNYLNSTLFNWLTYREQLLAQHKLNYAYTSTYDELMPIIKQCSDLEHLKQVRLNIISEIMLSTTLKNIKKSRGIGADKSLSPESSEKGELLYSRNLPKYLSQLKMARSACEKKIHQLGGAEYLSYVEESQQLEKIPGSKIFSFQVIMQSEEARSCLCSFLKKSNKDVLLRFWEAVEDMKKASRSEQYRLANQIHDAFLSQKSSLLLQILNVAIFKSMRAYMIGNEGPEGFWESQSVVYDFLEEKCYGSFIASDIYHQYVSEFGDFVVSSDILDSLSESADELKPDTVSEEASEISVYSTYAREKLELLESRIQNKSDAMNAIQELQRTDPETQRLMVEMRRELDALTNERRHLEYHIEQTGLWMHHLGHWKAYISDADVIPDGNRDVAVFVIVINLVGKSKRATFEEVSSSTGASDAWIVTRKLEDFEQLFRDLVQIVPSIRNQSLALRLNVKRSESLQKAREGLQTLLNTVLEDELLAYSAPVFAFLSKSLEFLQRSTADQQQLKINNRTPFSTSAIFKRMARSFDRFASPRSRNELDRKEGALDTAAQPLYHLLANVFELTGLSNWLRRTLVSLVQVTYGKSINRKIQETVEWIVSEPMLIYYLNLFRDAYWPGGRPAVGRMERPSDEQKQRIQIQAKKKLLDSIPGAVKNLLGDDKARRGIVRVFDAFQDSTLNRHFFYTVLDMFMKEAFVRHGSSTLKSS